MNHNNIIRVEGDYFVHSPIYTPLKMAVKRGDLMRVKGILDTNPDMAKEIDFIRKSTPLHLASEEGHINIVEELLAKGPDMCWARDRDGMIPLHVAAINGRTEVVKMLIRSMPMAVRAKTKHGDTTLHLCVKHNQVEVLKMIVPFMDDEEFLNMKDADGYTLLRLAFLAVEIEAKTKHHESLGEISSTENQSKAQMILQFLQTRSPSAQVSSQTSQAQPSSSNPQASASIGNKDWERKNKGLMLVAAIIAAASYQSLLSPPGGFEAGQPIMATACPYLHFVYVQSNTAAFLLSLWIISPWKKGKVSGKSVKAIRFCAVIFFSPVIWVLRDIFCTFLCCACVLCTWDYPCVFGNHVYAGIGNFVEKTDICEVCPSTSSRLILSSSSRWSSKIPSASAVYVYIIPTYL